MTKEEIFDALKADGAKLTKTAQFISRENLEKMFEERFGYPVQEAAPSGTPVGPEPRLLRFADSGWCEALGRSYTRGLYRPADAAEYLALKPYAAEVL